MRERDGHLGVPPSARPPVINWVLSQTDSNLKAQMPMNFFKVKAVQCGGEPGREEARPEHVDE